MMNVQLHELVLPLDGEYMPDEVFLTTTSRTILPVTRANGSPIGSGQPGPLVGRLQQAWVERFEFDFVAQELAHLEG